MSRKRKTKKRCEFEEVPMTPMIDIVFQLLIFFLTTFSDPPRESEIEAARPQSQNAGLPDPNILQIYIYHAPIERSGVSNNLSVPKFKIERPGATLIPLELVEDFLAETASIDLEAAISITPMVDSYHRDLMAVLDLCARFKLENINVMSGQET